MLDDYLNIRVLNWNKDKKIRICIISINKKIEEIIETFNMKYKNEFPVYWEGYINEYANMIIHYYPQNKSDDVNIVPLTESVLAKNYDYYFYIGTSETILANLYDVIIANQIVYFKNQASSFLGEEPDTKAPEISEKTNNIINAFLARLSETEKFPFTIEAAPVFSGEKLATTPTTINFPEGTRYATIDMTSFGMFQALRFYQSSKCSNEHFIIIQGVSNRANEPQNRVYDDGLNADERENYAIKNALTIFAKFIYFIQELESPQN